jgi:hypothetical protein
MFGFAGRYTPRERDMEITEKKTITTQHSYHTSEKISIPPIPPPKKKSKHAEIEYLL